MKRKTAAAPVRTVSDGSEDTIRNRIGDLRSELSASLIERNDEIEAVLLGLVAREHVLFVGPPGTAKSQLATSTAKAIRNASVFTRLLTKHTTPEEIFGPLKLSALKEDKYERALEGYAATSHIVFFDEIWKASSAILNTLLTFAQEREYDNGGERIACPVREIIAASNEYPSAEDGQELGAIFDRFLIRREVRPVSVQGQRQLFFSELPKVGVCTTLADIDAAADQASALPFSTEAANTYLSIIEALRGEGIRPGDRRSRKATGVAKAAAWLDGSDEVKPVHLECLKDVLWTAPEQRDKCIGVVTRLANPVGAKLDALLMDSHAIIESIVDLPTRMAAIKKLEECVKTAEDLTKDGNGRATKVHKHLRRELTRQTAIGMGMSEEAVQNMMKSQD